MEQHSATEKDHIAIDQYVERIRKFSNENSLLKNQVAVIGIIVYFYIIFDDSGAVTTLHRYALWSKSTGIED